MSVSVSYLGGFGNNLFQYIYARLFAEKDGLQLTIPFNNGLVRMTPQSGQSFSSPKITIRNGNVLETKAEPASYQFNGDYQIAEWYIPYIQRIKEFAIPQAPINKNTEDIVLHLRLSDYPAHTQIDPSWYLGILAQEQWRKLYIVIDPKQPAKPLETIVHRKFFSSAEYLEFFKPLNPTIVSSDMGHDWNFIRQFDRIIMSNSTFCFWAGFFSQASKIYSFEPWLPVDNSHLSNMPMFTQVDGKYNGEYEIQPSSSVTR